MHGRGWLHSPLPCPLSVTRLPFLLMQGRKKMNKGKRKKEKVDATQMWLCKGSESL